MTRFVLDADGGRHAISRHFSEHVGRGELMVLTPTYHVFDLYQRHQDATSLPLDVRPDRHGSPVPLVN